MLPAQAQLPVTHSGCWRLIKVCQNHTLILLQYISRQYQGLMIWMGTDSLISLLVSLTLFRDIRRAIYLFDAWILLLIFISRSYWLALVIIWWALMNISWDIFEFEKLITFADNAVWVDRGTHITSLMRNFSLHIDIDCNIDGFDWYIFIIACLYLHTH